MTAEMHTIHWISFDLHVIKKINKKAHYPLTKVSVDFQTNIAKYTLCWEIYQARHINNFKIA